MNILLRRRGLGKTSCDNIARFISNYGQELSVVRNDNIPHEMFETVIRWGCTSNITNERIIQTARSIHLSSDKAGCRKLFQDNHISVPRSFFDRNFHLMWSFPLIGREQLHSQGRNIKIIHNERELQADHTSAYWSKFIDKDKEYRVYTFFGRIIQVAEKNVIRNPDGTNPIAWNQHGGGSIYHNVRWDNWPLKVCLEALRASELIKIDFSGTDVMVKDNDVYVLEINSAPSITGNYDGHLFAKSFAWALKEIERTGRRPNHFELPTNVRNYKQVIHPEILNRGE